MLTSKHSQNFNSPKEPTCRAAVLVFGLLLVGGWFTAGPARAATPPVSGSVFMNPIEITREGLEFVGHEGLLFVPENRAAKDSRQIAVHFFRFPAKQPTDLAPVFYLPGGPGSAYGVRHFYEYYGGDRAKSWTTELEVLNQKRDLIIVNQRGNSRAPGMQPDLSWKWEPQPLDQPSTATETRRAFRRSVERNVQAWQERGVDLAGYDILNIVDDLDDLRQAFGYQKIALRGTSFGSQWSLAYMRRYPQRVDRALLSGVEPLDHAYDSPQGLWNALQRLERRALDDPALVKSLPTSLVAEGLLDAFMKVVGELEATPSATTLEDSESDETVEVVLGADDLRDAITGSIFGSRRDNLAVWPSFVSEVVAGDLRIVAAEAADDRQDTTGGPMIGLLIDNSLGISSEREARLRAEPAFQALGDINLGYTASRDITPTPTVDDGFRKFESTDIPVLMIQGDLDFSTPHENAVELLPFLNNGHLVTVRDGTHSAFRELIQLEPDQALKMLAFINEDFATKTPTEFFASLPETVSLPPLAFRKHQDRALYEDYLD